MNNNIKSFKKFINENYDQENLYKVGDVIKLDNDVLQITKVDLDKRKYTFINFTEGGIEYDDWWGLGNENHNIVIGNNEYDPTYIFTPENAKFKIGDRICNKESKGRFRTITRIREPNYNSRNSDDFCFHYVLTNDNGYSENSPISWVEDNYELCENKDEFIIENKEPVELLKNDKLDKIKKLHRMLIDCFENSKGFSKRGGFNPQKEFGDLLDCLKIMRQNTLSIDIKIELLPGLIKMVDDIVQIRDTRDTERAVEIKKRIYQLFPKVAEEINKHLSGVKKVEEKMGTVFNRKKTDTENKDDNDDSTKSKKRYIEVTFTNGDSLKTEINGTVDEIKKYYIGKTFNMGHNGDDLITKGKSVKFLDK
jgi:hypothetical protein